MGINMINNHSIQQAYSTFDMVWATLAKFCLHVGNGKFNTQNEE
jgi:hypothetical protein